MNENEHPLVPLKEIHRLQRLYDFDVLDSSPDANLDKITRIACEVVGNSESFLAFVDESKTSIKSLTGSSDILHTVSKSPVWRKLLLNENQQVITDYDNLNILFVSEVRNDIAFCVTTPLKSMEGFIIGSLVVFGKKVFQNVWGVLFVFDGLSQVLMDQLAIRLRAKKAFKAHLDLVHHTVHDLKNPLSTVILSAEIIASETNAESPILEFSAAIIRNARKMEERLNRLLDLSRMEDANYHLDLKDNDLIELIRSVIEKLEKLSKNKNQKIFLKSDKQLMLRCDYDRMEEVFENLISNAVKFSTLDSVILVEIQSRENEVVVVVKDKGQGLTQLDQDKLFTKFAKLSAVPTGMETSHGLGLSIVKTLVELHLGKVWAESEGKNTGSSFFVSLPLHSSDSLT
jgi:signal transduction histidine kinase